MRKKDSIRFTQRLTKGFTQRFSRRFSRRGVVVLVLLLFVGAALESDRTSKVTVVAEQELAGFPPPDSAISSVWYCPLITATKTPDLSGTVTVLNIKNVSLAGTVTFMTPGASPVDVPLTVSANSTVTLKAVDFVSAEFVSALVRIDGSGAMVEHSVRNSTVGEAFSPCLSHASDTWHFGYGNSAAGSGLLLGLFNPFPEDAIVDVDMVTNEGQAQPQAFQRAIVPAHNLVVLNISNEVRRRDWIAGSVKVRRGRLAVDQLQTGLINGVQGLGFAPLVSNPALEWNFSSGEVADNISTQIALFNPSDVESATRVDVALDDGTVQSFDLRVPQTGRIALDLNQQVRIPKGSRFAVKVVSINGVAIVPAKTSTMLTPAPVGSTLDVGGSLLSRRWALPVGRVQDPWDELIFVANPGDIPVDVSVNVVGDGKSVPVPTVAHIEPHHRFVFHLDESTSVDSSVVVESSAVVSVSRQLTSGKLPATLSQGIPLR